MRCIPLSIVLSSNIAPKNMSRIYVGDVGLGSHSKTLNQHPLFFRPNYT
jgi:hypothetical protein